MSRSIRLVRGMSASALSRGLAAIAPLITVPVSLKFLGVAGYGAWTAALAVTALAAFADLGIGAGLMTKLAAALATNNVGLARRLVSSAYVALGALIAIVVGLLWASSTFVDWGAFVGGPSARGDATVATIALITISAFFVNAVVMLIVRIQYAAQQVALSNLWQAAGSLAGIGAIYAAANLARNSAEFVAIAAFMPALVAMLNTLYFFTRGRGAAYRPTIHDFRSIETRALASIGGKFLIINVLLSASLSTDSWIVAHTATLHAVTEYSIPARVFAVIGTAVSVLTIPLWPANAEALSRGDIEWVRTTTRRMTVITPVLVGTISIAAVSLAPTLLQWWLGDKIHPSFILLIGLGTWSLVQALVAPIFMVQNAVGVLRPQIIGYSILLIAIPIKWVISAEVGYEWLPLASSVTYAAIIWPAAWIGYRASMRKAALTQPLPSPVPKST